MLQETIYNTPEEVKDAQLAAIVDAAGKMYKSKPIRILDIATGPNGFNHKVIRVLVDKGIDYELILSDASPTHFREGYENLKNNLSTEELKKIKCVLVDSRDLKTELAMIPLYGEKRMATLGEILENPRYQFLHTGYIGNKRTIDFSDGSFDLIIGCIPYGSIGKDYGNAIIESARILKDRGYHIVNEMHVEKINPDIERTYFSLKRAQYRLIDDVRSRLDAALKPISTFSAIYKYLTEDRFPEETLQYGDTVKLSALVHQK
jgi:hypothetical protein